MEPDIPVVGRETERQAGNRFLDALASRPEGLLFEGEAGIGKTTLWKHVAVEAERRGYRLLSSRPGHAENRLSFVALADLLVDVDPDLLEQIPDPQQRALRIALLLEGGGGRPPDKRTIATAFLSVLSVLVRSAPVVVAVDDIQWLDTPSAAAIDFALRRLGSRPIGFLGSRRVPTDSELAVTLDAALPRGSLRHVPVGPLSLASIHHILEARLGRAFSRPVLVRLERAAGGNPFFALEIAGALIASGEDPSPGEPLPVPDNLRELVARRLSPLPKATREALLLVSACPRPTTALLGALGGGEGEAEALLEPAKEAGVVEIRNGRIAFTHPLLASAVYASAGDQRRLEIHARLAAVVADEEERARHLALGAAGPEEQVAAALERAAASASARGAPEAAAEMCEQAIRLTPHDRSADLRRRTVAAGTHSFTAGDRLRARELLESAIADSSPGPERADALRILGEVRYHDDSFLEAIGLFKQAVHEAMKDEHVAAMAELDLAFALVSSGDVPAGEPHASAALRHAEAVGDEGLLAEALAVGVMASCLAGRGVDERTLERALELEDPDRPTPFEFRPSLIAALLWFWTERLDRAQRSLERLRLRMVESGQESVVPLFAYHLVSLACVRGELDLADRYANDALETADLLGNEAMRAVSLSAAAMVGTHRGRIEAARSQAREALEIFQRMGWRLATLWPLGVIGLLELSLEDYAAVDQALGDLAGAVAAYGLGEPMSAPFLAEETEALVALGQLERARVLIQLLERQGRTLDRPWALAVAARSRALLLAADGDTEGALDAASEALEHHRRMQMPLELARTMLVKGKVERRAKRWGQARKSLEQAARMFHALGTPVWEERAREQLDRIGGRPPTAFDLTPTESDIAELAASGMSNREVAGALFLSPKTVGGNLTKIYRKLDVHSRTELAWKMASKNASASDPN